MRKIKLIINYDGTDFNGFQYQPSIRTVQGEIEKSLSLLTKEKIRIIGSSRTDSGVHANGQVVSFDTKSKIPPEKYTIALRKFLPRDINVLRSTEVSKEFFPIGDALAKRYSYFISGNTNVHIRDKRFCYHIGNELDLDRINKACDKLIGTKDFKSFCASGSESKTTVRTIYYAKIEEHYKNEYYFTIVGSGFLYKMVRIIVGSLIKVGIKKLSIEEFENIIKLRDRKLAPITAPSQGLCLEEVYYNKEFLDKYLTNKSV